MNKKQTEELKKLIIKAEQSMMDNINYALFYEPPLSDKQKAEFAEWDRVYNLPINKLKRKLTSIWNFFKWRVLGVIYVLKTGKYLKEDHDYDEY